MDTTTRPKTVVSTDQRPAVPGLLTAVHLVDVLAPGMEGLARWLAEAGADVTGSIPEAARNSPVVAALEEAGVRVHVGFDAGHVRTDRTAVVWSGIVAGPHPELDRAQVLRLPVIGRAVALKALSVQAGAGAVAVAGSHSTTTAAAALAHVLDDGRTGWVLTAPARDGAAGHAGGGGRVVVDLCPDAGTHEAAPPGAWQHRPAPHFLHSEPKFAAALILATSANTPHFEDNVAGLDAAERLARSAAVVVLPTWDTSTANLRERLGDRPVPDQRVVTVGTDPASTVWIMTPRWTGEDFRVVLRYQETDHAFVLPVAGRHHALAMCAAIATALVLGEDPQAVAERATSFRGVERSLSTLGSHRHVTVVDSRARHPHEVAQDVQAARMLTDGSLLVVMEPDGIARTSAHAAELGAALEGVDHALLLPVSTPLLHHAVPDPLDAVERAARRKLGDGKVQRARFGPCEPGPEQLIGELAAEGDLVLVVGTGQAERLGARLLFHLAAPGAPIPQHL
ncbi:Mur ligase domain-containing protein [Kitasatospora purpeofusca]|uniref:Mur ligase domain-containing protein n=1 Tax=Kitasatospora purpeofusca TaxID=67352 RepID=UPI00224CEB5A|nr:Mur ligase domain-containing protein [Kitasatospora purpeofusca]MCX4758681.1 Mur ligase domain-containing protein [Kitasatospora purpeofusca]WSR30885.1 Mur ligase domain-containing protein [Kitasatospora purpeofusca]